MEFLNDKEIKVYVENVQNKKSRKFLYLSAVIVHIMSFSIGYDYSWSSPISSKLTDTSMEDNPIGRPITTDEKSWIVSLLMLGAAIGPILGGILSDNIGRKPTMLIFSLPVTVTYLILTFSDSVGMYYFARFAMGLCVGIHYTVSPIYIGEIAEPSNKGKLNCLSSAFVSGGILFGYLLGLCLKIKMLSGVLSVFPVIFFVLFSIFIPESPAYLFHKEKYRKSKESLAKFRSGTPIDGEFKIMSSRKNINSNFLTLLKKAVTTKSLLLRLSTLIFLMALQQLTAYGALVSYTEVIFKKSSISISPNIPPVINGVIQLISSVVASLVVERLGRKLLLFVSLLGTFLSLLSLGACFYLQDEHYDFLSWLPIVSVAVHIAMYNLGSGPVPFAVLTDLFPSDVISLASSLSTTISFLFGFLVSKGFPLLADSIGIAEAFWLFGAFNGVSIVLLLYFLPETKNFQSN